MNQYYRSREALEQGKRLKEIILNTKQVHYKDIKKEKIAAITIPKTESYDEGFIFGESKINTYKLKIFCEPYELQVGSNLLPIEIINQKDTKKTAFLYSPKTIQINVYERETDKRRKQKGVYKVAIDEKENLEIKTLKILPKDQKVMPLDKKQLEEILMRVKVIKRSE